MLEGLETLRPFVGRLARIGAVGMALAVSGCLADGPETAPVGGAAAPSGDSRSAVTKFISGGDAPYEIDPEALAGDLYCPSIRLSPNTHLVMNYARGKQDDPTGLNYQATVENWARDCRREGAAETRIKIGVSGHVTPGPAWPGGEVVLPVRVIITDDSDKPVQEKVVDVPVTVGAGSASETWTMIENSFVVPRDQELQILVGFDEKATRRR